MMLLITRRKGLRMINREALVKSQLYLTENEAKLLINYYEDILSLAKKDMRKSFACFAIAENSVHCHSVSEIEGRLFQLRNRLSDVNK